MEKITSRTHMQVGESKIIYNDVAAPIADGLKKFAGNLNSRIGALFDIPVSAEVSISNKVENARSVFLRGAECDYVGDDMPKGWELKKTSKGYLFHAKKMDMFLEVRNESNKIIAKLYSSRYDLGLLRHGIIDLLQLGTTNLLVHSVGLEKDGIGILLLAESGSGKTTLLVQLINARYNFNLVTEGYSLISKSRMFQIKTAGLLRKGALKYLDMSSSSDEEVEFKDYVGTVGSVKKVDIIISPLFNLDSEYSIEKKNIMIKPLYRDWAMQPYDSYETKSLIMKKRDNLDMLPREGFMMRYSTDPKRTVFLFETLLGML